MYRRMIPVNVSNPYFDDTRYLHYLAACHSYSSTDEEFCQ